jgi:hypothetical protein
MLTMQDAVVGERVDMGAFSPSVTSQVHYQKKVVK